ncbi:hypothetical protein AwDysgo_03630 [Bacteroidales bacterium]|nr:hypothetical protein AwDysgo_03630 [Bacteroidales bacterium]
MKKIIFILSVLMLISASTSAQFLNPESGDKAVGASFKWGSKVKAPGIGFTYHQYLSSRFRIAPSLTYFLNRNEQSGWDMSTDAHFIFPIANEKVRVYPIMGITLNSIKYHAGSYSGFSNTEVGANVGAGIQYHITGPIFAVGEAKYTIIRDIDQLGIGIGLTCLF